MKKEDIEEIEDETETALFDLDEESSSEELDDNLETDLVGSENLRSNIVTGGIVATLLALSVVFVKKFVGKKTAGVPEGTSNYDPVHFEF